MKIRLLVISIVFIATSVYAQVQVPVFGKIKYLKGYAHEIQGENINYNSALPDVAKSALLTRCTDGKKTIEWETEAVPSDVHDKYIYFAWLAAHSKGTSHGDRSFDLYINDRQSLTFKTFDKRSTPFWTFTGQNGEQLVFEWKMDDAAGDAHGYMYLRVPASIYEKGKPLKIKIIGHNENSPDWFMTFKYTFDESIDIVPVKLKTKDNRQSLNVVATHFGGEVPLSLLVDGKEKYRYILKPGLNNFEIYHDAVQSETPVHVRASIPGQPEKEFTLVLKPVQQREIHFIHHSHYDVGYSDLQEEVARTQVRNIKNALRYIDETRNLPREAQFKWNIETTLAIENFLKVCTPEQKGKFVKAIKDGNIGIGGLYAGISTGLCQPEELFRLTSYAQKLENMFGIEIPAAMITDIPGMTWATIPALANSGIRYFSSGPNYVASLPDEGDRVGHSNKNWADRPFWWTSPSGNEKILYWVAGKGYSSWHGMKAGDISIRGKKKIAAYMDELDAEGYPFEMVQWRYNIVSDNGPTDSLISQFVADWNVKYSSPKIVLNTIDGMFREFEARYGDKLPAFSGDLTPYWEDGAYSTAAEMAMNRRNSEKLTQLTNLYALIENTEYPAEMVESAWDKVLLFNEHTWGAYNSITDPDIPFVTEQWKYKQKFALDADSLVNLLAKPFRLPANAVKIDVFNTLSWPRTDVVYVEALAAGSANCVVDGNGDEVLSQKLSDGRIAFLASDVPPLGSKRYILKIKDQIVGLLKMSIDPETIENELFKIIIDPANGSIESLIWKPLNIELTDTRKLNGLNEFLYVAGRNPEMAATNSPVNSIKLKENGPLMAVVQLTGDAPGCHSLKREISVIKGIARVEIANTINKIAIREKESVHFAFPFSIPDAVSRYNTGWGGIFQPGVNQLAGANQDYYSVQHWCDVSNQQYGVSLLLREACLVEPGEMIDEQVGKFGVKEWKTNPNTSPTLFSYVMNNYWHTNFKADQEGNVTFHYALIPHGLFNATETEKQGLSFNQPLMILPAQSETITAPLFTISNSSVILTSIASTPQGFAARLYNTGAAPVQFKLESGRLILKSLKIKKADGVYEDAGLSEQLSLPAFGIMEAILLK